jgi:hypothetical protein
MAAASTIGPETGAFLCGWPFRPGESVLRRHPDAGVMACAFRALCAFGLWTDSARH